MVHKNNAVYPVLLCNTLALWSSFQDIQMKYNIEIMFHAMMTRYVGSNVRDIM